MLFTNYYMKYLYLLLLFLPLQALGQIKLQDVTISSQRPKFVRLKGYYRSYQHNDSVLKYYVDGIVEYYINLKNEKVDIRMYSSRHLRNEELISKDKKRVPIWSPRCDGLILNCQPMQWMKESSKSPTSASVL